MPDNTPTIFLSLLNKLIDSNAPAESILITREHYRPSPQLGINCPRFSICLSGKAQYDTLPHHGPQTVALNPHGMIFASHQHLMRPHPAARYTSLGIVFQRQFTRYLLARKRVVAGKPQHEFLHVHHAASLLDDSGLHLCKALDLARPTDPHDPYVRSLLHALLIKAKDMLTTTDPSVQGKAIFTWQAACHFVQEHLNAPLSREDVAAFLKLHPNHISRLFHTFAKQSFSAYVMEKRLLSARELLRDPRLNISEIAYACGFTSANYFIRSYRQHFGHSPGKNR